MKTLWKQSPKAPSAPNGFVTHAELPALVRRIVAEAMTSKVVIESPSPLLAAGAVAAKKTKYPRAIGHTHRGRCGKKCF